MTDPALQRFPMARMRIKIAITYLKLGWFNLAAWAVGASARSIELANAVESWIRNRRSKWTRADFDALDEAIASGECVVQHSDGRRIRFRSLEELKIIDADSVMDFDGPLPDTGRRPGGAVGAAMKQAPKTTMLDGNPVTDDHREIQSDGRQKGYVVLSKEERAKGFNRPVRTKYKHDACSGVTTLHHRIAETYARDPKFYNGTFCAICREHFPIAEFTWDGTEDRVGS